MKTVFCEWFRPPRHVLLIFLIVSVVSLGTLAWLAAPLLQQEKAVEAQRRQDRLEQVADRAAAVMQGALAALEVQLASRGARPDSPPPADVVIVKVAEAPDSPFVEAEQAEFSRGDLRSAARLYAKLAEDPNAAVRAGALTRLARVYRKMSNDASALEVYDRALRISGVYVAGLPLGLIAREGRAAIFERAHRENDLREEGIKRRNDLHQGRWLLTKSQSEFYAAEALNENRDAVSRAEAFEWLWQNRRSTEPAGRRLMETSGGPALVMWSSTSDATLNAAIGRTELSGLSVPTGGVRSCNALYAH
jgi:tetratricopeptide (TPR) repeat protein